MPLVAVYVLSVVFSLALRVVFLSVLSALMAVALAIDIHLRMAFLS